MFQGNNDILSQDVRGPFILGDPNATAGQFAVWIVLEGSGRIAGQPAERGDTFAVPAAADSLDVSGDLRILRCLGPAVTA